jgi:three-Cys-motif partner protein
MPRKANLKFDQIGYWSEIKLEIIKAYGQEYSKIISAQKRPSIRHVYIDAFAGAGLHKSKSKEALIPGSPLNALSIQPPFKEYHFIDLNPSKVENLEKVVEKQYGQKRSDIHIYTGDCNAILLKKVFPRAQYRQYRRGLCLLDPYGLHLNWEVIRTAGHMKSIEIFLNFPVADMNRNVFWHNPENVKPADIERMNAYWGDDTWKNVAYTTSKNLFGYAEKEQNKIIAEHFKQRLRKVAAFKYVSEPLPMRNSRNAIVYYLYFASQRPVAKNIVDYIFNKYSKN